MNAALGLWVAAVAGSDVAARRVPNVLLLVMLLVSLAALTLTGQGLLHATWAQSFLGAVLALALTLPAYGLRQLGAGDVKFAACLGFVLGPVSTLETLLVAAMILGLMSVFVLLVKRRGERPRWIPAAPALAAGFAAVLAFGPLLPRLAS